jgi:diguanylate cyclase (GGDEF)-like protein
MKDPRLLEIELLSGIEAACTSASGFVYRHPSIVRLDERFMMDAMLHLAFDGAVLVSDAYDHHPSNLISGRPIDFQPGTAELDRAILKTTRAVLQLSRADVNLVITQRGRLRLYRLRDEILNRDRVRDDFGILWSKRHYLPDLEVRLRFREPTAPLSIILLDVDRLKLINTTYSHAGADEVLRGIFEILRDKVQPADAYRLGGDEAGAVLLGIDTSGASRIAEDIRATVAQTFENKKMEGGVSPTVTLAVGAATATDSAERLHHRVDAHLTMRKDKGGQRNTVHVLEAESPAGGPEKGAP